MQWSKHNDTELLKLKAEGLNNREIGQRIGVSTFAVQSRLGALKVINAEDFLTDIYRFCPSCGEQIAYKNKFGKIQANRNGSKCKKCIHESYKVSLAGEGNPFWGRKHSPETLAKISESNSGRRLSEEHRKKSAETLNNYAKKNPRKHPYEHWLIKYGKKIADEKMEELRKKNSEASSGERNPMFGKPTPKKSGNGWSGWYKDFYFRSLRELQFYVEHEGPSLIPIHLDRKYSVEYLGIRGQKRTYSADFILDNKTIIEIKPKKLWSSRENVLKFEAMKEFCEKIGLEFLVLDVIPNSHSLKEKYLNGEIKFDKKCDDKFKKYCGII